MNIVIPVCGKGQRFLDAGYTSTKSLIKVLHKTMIEHVLDWVFMFKEEQDQVIIIHNKFSEEKFVELIRSKYSSVQLVCLQTSTSGAAATIYLGLKQKELRHLPAIILDCDTIYTENVLSIFRESGYRNTVFYTINRCNRALYSYIQLDEINKIMSVKEKVKISDNANTGCYAFSDVNFLLDYCKKVLDNGIVAGDGEPYTSCVIQEMINDGLDFYGSRISSSRVFSLGTPLDLQNYSDHAHFFLFDLDGTLVNTDEVYFEVWREILRGFNLDLTEDIFFKRIHGQSDNFVCKSLLDVQNTSNISNKKDELFLKSMERLKLIDGSIDYVKKVRESGHFAAIVTNCNRPVAEAILCHVGLSSLVEFIVVGSECERTKPYPDPYITAASKFEAPLSKCIVFEDSKTGLLSAKAASPKLIVGVESLYSSDDLLLTGASLSIKNYIDLDVSSIIKHQHFEVHKLKSYIKQSINLEISDVLIDSTKLKGGFISDIISLQLVTDQGIIYCVLKLENKNESQLSKMATNLGLYDREYYFYEHISHYTNCIRTPKCFGVIKDDKLNNIGILMENLYKKGNHVINLDLNSCPVSVSLRVIDSLAAFHSKFWNKPLKSSFGHLKLHSDSLFRPSWGEFVSEKWNSFKQKWSAILTPYQIEKGGRIVRIFPDVQSRLSSGHLTLIHGDVKSPNIFYDKDCGLQPVFIDWQYIAIGKGAQDLVFFLIESFNLEYIRMYLPLFKHYYFVKLKENGINDYEFSVFEQDVKDSICYFPFFVALWFGTIQNDELIDKNFPFFFIQKLFHVIDITSCCF